MTVRFLDLFSGTGSVARVARKLKYDVKTLDIDTRERMDFTVDILEFDYTTELGNWVPDIIWASPPCTYYSVANTRGVRDIPYANRVVRRVLQLIAWVQRRNPDVRWILENPQTGLLKDQSFMSDLPFVDADYCCYGYPFRKRTRFWTNAPIDALELCPGVGRCPQMVGRSHKQSVGNGHPRYGTVLQPREKYSIPARLVTRLISV